MTVNSPRIWQFIKRTLLVFHVFIAVAVMVYLVAAMVCGHHGTGPSNRLLPEVAKYDFEDSSVAELCTLGVT